LTKLRVRRGENRWQIGLAHCEHAKNYKSIKSRRLYIDWLGYFDRYATDYEWVGWISA